MSALTPTGPFVAALPQPSDNHRVSRLRTEGLLTKTMLFRASLERGSNQRDNQGISELDLPERGYRREDVDYSTRFSLEGGQRRPFHVRFQYDQDRDRRPSPTPSRRPSSCRTRSAAGGASVSGGNRSRAVVSDTMFTLRPRPYTLRVGSLMNVELQPAGAAQ